jgi:hypothetical protein
MAYSCLAAGGAYFMLNPVHLKGDQHRLWACEGQTAYSWPTAPVSYTATWCIYCRRAKNVLLTDAVQELQKLIKKGKGATRAVIAQRQQKVQHLSR